MWHAAGTALKRYGSRISVVARTLSGRSAAPFFAIRKRNNKEPESAAVH
jgi:hypothetical protein